jgi:SAM domain (Sterile alpha motif)
MEGWLRSIGLTKRIEAFRENGITFDQLGDLTEQDMRELGLTIGERKRFRQAVRQRQMQRTGDAISNATPALDAERRPLTVMFVDCGVKLSRAAGAR